MWKESLRPWTACLIVPIHENVANSFEMNIMRNFLQRYGVDRAISFTLLGRFWNSIANVCSIFIITKFLSDEEQGYYYTFGSLIGLQVFFELGLAFVIMQSASHERAPLVWNDEGILEGASVPRARLASLLRVAMYWYGVISLLFVCCTIPAGLYFFANQKNINIDISWGIPWIWLVIATVCNLNMSPLLAFIEGCGQVSEVAFIRVIQGIGGMISFWVALACGLKLYAVPLMSMVSFFVGMYWIYFHKGHLIKDILHAFIPSIRINWWNDVWPFQWRIAVSWLSGYFIFQLFTPVLFAFHGPAAAGRMGMSITMTGAISTVALAWVTTKSPLFGKFAALRQIKELDILFFKSFRQVIWISCFFACLMIGLVIVLNTAHSSYSDRLLQPLPFGLLAAAAFVNVIVSAEAIYLRSFREEPFLKLSLLNGLFIGTSTYFLGRYFGVTEMMAGYLVINVVVGLGLGTWILNTKRNQWHKEFSQGV